MAAGEWWQMDLGSVKQVKGVVTQGCGSSGDYCSLYHVFTWSYKVKVRTRDVEGWRKIDSGKVFVANHVSGNEKVVNIFDLPVPAQSVRIVVDTWTHYVQMRAAVLLDEDLSGGALAVLSS